MKSKRSAHSPTKKMWTHQATQQFPDWINPFYHKGKLQSSVFEKKGLTFIVRTIIINVRTIKEVQDVPEERTTV